MRYDFAVIGAEIERIRLEAEAQGLSYPHELIRIGRDPACPFHTWFTWDVMEAAEKCWLEEARQLIKVVRVTYTYERTEELIVPLYVSTHNEAGDRRYDTIVNVMSDAERRQQLVRETLVRVRGILANVPERVCQQLAARVEKELGKL